MAIADRFELAWTPFLKKKDGKLLQAVAIVCPTVLGSGGEFTLHAGGVRRTVRPIDLLRYPQENREQTQPARYLWLIPRPDRPIRITAAWKTTLGQMYRDTITLSPARPMQVTVVFKTHLDLGYTHRIADVIRLYQTTFMEKLLDNLDRTAQRPPGRRFVWTLSTWLLEQCLDRKAVKPDHLRRFEKHIRDGSVAWGLMPFTTHSEFFGLEEMCRSLYAARRLAERFSRPVPTAAKMTDVPAHTMSLAMAFAAAGGRFFQVGTNPESAPPDVPPLFWWKLPDGNRILTHYHASYGTPLLPPETWPWDHWLAMQMTNDNVGPQNLETIDRLEWIAGHFDYPVCRTGRLEDFAEGIIHRHAGRLPGIDKECTDWWVYGIASNAGATAAARIDKERLPSVETLTTLAALNRNGTTSDAAVEGIRRAYQSLSLYTEHTWGDHATDIRQLVPTGNLYTNPLLASDAAPAPLDRWVASWDDKAQFARDARAATDAVESAAVTDLARQFGGGRGLGLALFNTVSWSRGGLVRFSDRRLPAREFELVDPTTGGLVDYERTPDGIEFIAPSVPPCGYLVLQIRQGRHRSRSGLAADWDTRNLTLHTNDTTLQFHNAGGLARWHDRARSSQWCSDKAEFPLGTYLYEMPGGERLRDFARQVHSNTWAETVGFFHRHDYTGMSQFGPVGGSRATVTPEITPLRMRVTVQADCPVRRVPGRRAGDARRYRTVFTMYRGSRDMHVQLSLVGKRATYAAEAGYGFFPFAGDEPWILVDRIAHQIQKADLAGRVNAAHMAVSRGVRIEFSHAGLNFYPLNAPLVGFGRPGAYSFDPDNHYRTGILYSTLFNNCWGTNFRQWQSGDFTFDYVLRPTGNDEWDGGLAQGGAEVFRPLLPALVTAPTGDFARTLLAIEPPSVQLVTLKPAECGSGTVLRLWNADVDPVKAILRLPFARRGDVLAECDLLERPTRRRALIRESGEVTVSLSSNQIATFLLERRLTP